MHWIIMVLSVIRRRVQMKHHCELRFRLHRAFTHASLSRVTLCVSWAFLVLLANVTEFGNATTVYDLRVMQAWEHRNMRFCGVSATSDSWHPLERRVRA